MLCTVCEDGRRELVNDALDQGGSVRAVARLFGFTKSSVDRHRRQCLPAQTHLSPAQPEMLSESADLSKEGLVAMLERSLARLERAAADAASNGLDGSLATLTGQLHKGIEAAAKLQGITDLAPIGQLPTILIQLSAPAPAPAQTPLIR